MSAPDFLIKFATTSSVSLDAVPLPIAIIFTLCVFIISKTNSGTQEECGISELKNSFDNISYDMSIDYIYDIRADKNADGMSIKEALHHMKKVGYISNKDYKNNSLGRLKTIDYYVKLNSITYIKYSLLSKTYRNFLYKIYY